VTRSVLGISAFYHDSAAALVRGGEIVAAAQEERFSRRKHDPRLPVEAINYCLEEADLEPDELDAVAFYDSPLLTWDRVVKSCLQTGESSAPLFEKAARSVLGIKLWVEEHVRAAMGSLGRADRLLTCEHHMSHAASAFYPSPFEEAAILTVDGVGEWCTTSIGMGKGDVLELHEEIDYPHSLGLLYTAFTAFCGFKANSGEYKLMGLAPYGRPVFADRIREHLIDVRPDGSYRLATEYFGFLDGFSMTNERFAALFGGPPREPETRITRREVDLAASIQEVTTEVLLRLARHARQRTGARRLVMAGGVALNCVANGVLQRERVFDEIFVQPAAGDAGGALGAALLASCGYFGEPRPRPAGRRDAQRGSFLGPAYGMSEIRAFLDRQEYPFEHVPNAEQRALRIAQALADGLVVGFFQGRMEFGPRSLGGRSILGDPRREDTQSRMNLKIKFRESFRPFAPAVLEEDAAEFFELEGESPYMLLVAPVRPERRLPLAEPAPGAAGDGDIDLLEIVNRPRSDLPAITHVDYSARVQTVDAERNPEFHRVLTAFKDLTGYGVLVNTSFNVRGEPIVCSPRDAYACFMRTGMDLLVLEECLLWKSSQPAFEDDEDWREVYGDD
jgi:carbamoyltransferase